MFTLCCVKQWFFRPWLTLKDSISQAALTAFWGRRMTVCARVDRHTMSSVRHLPGSRKLTDHFFMAIECHPEQGKLRLQLGLHGCIKTMPVTPDCYISVWSSVSDRWEELSKHLVTLQIDRKFKTGFVLFCFPIGNSLTVPWRKWNLQNTLLLSNELYSHAAWSLHSFASTERQ